MKRENITTHILSTALMLGLLMSAPLRAQGQQAPEQVAQQSAEAWLALVDAGKYGESWQEASSMFRAQVTKQQWQTVLKATLDPFGKNKSRKLLGAKYTKTLPGAPDGDYVVIQYESSFEHKQTAIETITPVLDKDGTWRVSGYFIK